MAFIKEISNEHAKGRLKKFYENTIERVGRVWNIARVMSVNPLQLESSMNFYKILMYGPSDLSRGQREMLAVVVSRINHCTY